MEQMRQSQKLSTFKNDGRSPMWIKLTFTKYILFPLFQVIHAINRAQIINDAFGLAKYDTYVSL